MALHCFSCLSIMLRIVLVSGAGLPINCKLQRRLVETCYSLLEGMGGLYPLQCLEENNLVLFPKIVFQSSTTQLEVSIEKSIYVILMHILSIFNNNDVPNQWNAQRFEDFQNIIYRQTEESKCIMNKTQDSLDDFLKREQAINAYYNKLMTVLQQKNFRYCAWEFVRNEILWTLQFILATDNGSMFCTNNP